MARYGLRKTRKNMRKKYYLNIIALIFISACSGGGSLDSNTGLEKEENYNRERTYLILTDEDKANYRQNFFCDFYEDVERFCSEHDYDTEDEDTYVESEENEDQYY